MKLANLESRLGHSFKSIELLERALTHRSWAHEQLPNVPEEKLHETENESFEFVGDSVLGLAVAEQLFLKHPGASEGDLTLMKHHLVSTTTLANIARSLDLGSYVRMGRGEEKTRGREKSAILANTLEAVLAAVFFDGGYITARACVGRLFAEEFRKATPKGSLDYKTLLQETLQAKRLAAPVYNVVRSEGQPHERKFFVEAVWSEGRSEGSGTSIKSAEMMAASEALKAIGEDNSKPAKRNSSN